MRYSTLASTILLAVATAPALAHPVTIRATEDASIVERELQDALIERGYYDDLVSRDLEARSRPMTDKERAAMVLAQRRQGQGQGEPFKSSRERAGTPHPHAGQSSSAQHSGSRAAPPLQHPQPTRPGPKAKAKFLRREYYLDELFIRTIEDASMVERELQHRPVERGYHKILSRDLETRKNADPDTPAERAAREQREMEQRTATRNAAHMQAGADIPWHFASHGYPSHAHPSHAHPSHAHPSHAHPSHAHPGGGSSQHGGAGRGAGERRPLADAIIIDNMLRRVSDV